MCIMERYLYQKLHAYYKEQHMLLMAYPAQEQFALSSLGYLWLYKIASTTEGIYAERAYTDKLDIKSMPNSIAFSMSFDFDIMGVFQILEKLNIPFYSKDRNNDFPLIFAGGPVITTNLCPYEDFFDFFIVGDGDDSFKEVLEILKCHSKEDSLVLLEKIEGVYIPSKTKNVKKITAGLNNVIYTPILSDKSYFKNTFIIELQRGCMNRCAFCTASYLNLPFRSYEYRCIRDAIDLGLKYTNKIALLGAQISAHPDFERIMQYIAQKMDSGENIELGISSLRTDSVSASMVQTLVKGGQRHSTIAIEAASERLRKFINKNLKEEQIHNAVRISRENGLSGLKIYSMLGIPKENMDDITEFIELGKRLRSENKGFNLEFSFSSFVPKPHTPFQWCPREDIKSLEIKQRYLEKEFAKIGIGVKFSSIKWDYWQAVLSRGGNELAPFLVEVYKRGANIGAYKSACKELCLKIKNEYGIEEKLPWDFIEIAPGKELLKKELKRLEKRL